MPRDLLPNRLPLTNLFPIVALLGRHAAPVPLAQSIAARALLPAASTEEDGFVTLATRLQRTASGALRCPLTSFG